MLRNFQNNKHFPNPERERERVRTTWNESAVNRGKWRHRHYRIPCVFNIYYIYSTMSITIIYSTPSSTAALNSSFVSLPTNLTSISYKLLSSSRPHRSFRLRTTLPPPILCASSSLSVSGTLPLCLSLDLFSLALICFVD